MGMFIQKNSALRISIRLIVLVLVFTFLISTTMVCAFEVEKPTPEFYVNDFAGVFSQEQKDEMQKRAVDLASSHDGIQVVVTTVNSLNGNSISSYAYKMYNEYRNRKRFNGYTNSSICFR